MRRKGTVVLAGHVYNKIKGKQCRVMWDDLDEGWREIVGRKSEAAQVI